MVPERLKPLLDEVSVLSQRFEAIGRALYLVGGAVRDAVWSTSSPVSGQDLDFTTDATPDETISVLEGWAQAIWATGKRFGTVGAIRDNRQLEITTHRLESYQPGSRKPAVALSGDLEADLARRDFTINAMALRLPNMELIDPFHGLDDLMERRLATPLGALASFSDDPLRMLRAARFIARFELAPVPDIAEAAATLAPRVTVVSAERVRDEMDKLLVTPAPSRGLRFLLTTGVMEQFLPELQALELEQDPVHRHKDVLEHTLAVVDRVRPDRQLRIAALLHDIGKPKTRGFGPEGVSFHHHELVGARMARERMRALRYATEDVAAVSRLVELHLRSHTYGLGWSDAAVRRYVRDAGPLLERLNELARGDCTTRSKRRAEELSRRMDELESRISELRAREDLDSVRPDLDGNEVMELLGIRPGPAVGEAMKFLYELRFDEGPLGKEAAAERLAGWWLARTGAS
ncbi:MAG: CCA tRNA nucleotidyltransferase [Acidimicrobiales bacterium]